MNDEQVAVELPGNGQGAAADASGAVMAPTEGIAAADGAVPAGGQIPVDGAPGDAGLAGNVAPDGTMADGMAAAGMRIGSGQFVRADPGRWPRALSPAADRAAAGQPQAPVLADSRRRVDGHSAAAAARPEEAHR